MEADWSVEIGSGLPCINASWEGFVDLQTSPQRIDTMDEAQHSSLRSALLMLNAKNSPVFTTKCDTWTLDRSEIDSDEFDADPEDAHAGFASYIDILEHDAAHFASFAFHEQRVRDLTSRLRPFALRRGRVDLVVRVADWKAQSGYGFTLYAASCGADETDAYAAWQVVLAAAVAATIAAAPHPPHAGE